MKTGSPLVEAQESTTSAGYSHLWQQLHAEGQVATNEAPVWLNPEPSAPWFIRLMLGIFGWLGGVFLMAFCGFFLIEHLQHEDVALLVMGLMLIGLACCINRIGHAELWQQLALALSLAGQGMAGFWLFATFGVDVAWPLFCIALFQCLLFVLNTDFLHRLLCVIISVLASHIGFLMWLGPSPILPICAALVALLWLDESYWQMRLRHAFLPIAAGLTVALLCLALTSVWFPSWLLTQVAGAHRNDGLGDSLYRWLYLLDPVIIGIVFFELVVRLSSALSTAWRRVALTCGLVFAILGVWVVGLVLGGMLILLGFARGRRWLVNLGIVASLCYLSWFYYSLDFTLLVKSIGLMVTGGLLLFGYFSLGYFSLSRLPAEIKNV